MIDSGSRGTRLKLARRKVKNNDYIVPHSSLMNSNERMMRIEFFSILSASPVEIKRSKEVKKKEKLAVIQMA